MPNEDAEKARHEYIDEMIELVRREWHENPQLRLGQMIENCATVLGRRDAYDIEDAMIAYAFGKIAARQMKA